MLYCRHCNASTCKLPAQILAAVADQVKNFAVIYLIDISEVPDFNTMYELYDPCTVMFFFRNKVRMTSQLLQHLLCVGAVSRAQAALACCSCARCDLRGGPL